MIDAPWSACQLQYQTEVILFLGEKNIVVSSAFLHLNKSFKTVRTLHNSIFTGTRPFCKKRLFFSMLLIGFMDIEIV